MAEKKSRWGRTAATAFSPYPFKCESDEADICATLHAVASCFFMVEQLLLIIVLFIIWRWVQLACRKEKKPEVVQTLTPFVHCPSCGQLLLKS